MAEKKQYASFERRDGKEHLRFSLDEYNGASYFSLRVWFRAADGEWRPTQKGVTVKLSEFHGLLDAMDLAAKETMGLTR